MDDLIYDGLWRVQPILFMKSSYVDIKYEDHSIIRILFLIRIMMWRRDYEDH